MLGSVASLNCDSVDPHPGVFFSYSTLLNSTNRGLCCWEEPGGVGEGQEEGELWERTVL